MTDVPDEVRERLENDPFCEAIGIELVELGEGRATAQMDVTENHMNFMDTLHGGACYSLADAAFGSAANSRGETAVALETNISYLEAVDAGETLVATAEETHRSSRTGEYDVVVNTADGDRVATFRGRVYLP